MKKTSKIVLFGGVAAVAAYFLYSRFMGGIGIVFSGIKWLGLDGLKLRFALYYTLSNANDTSATVTNLNAKLQYGPYDLSDVDINQPVTIPAGGSQKMEVLFSVRPGQLLAEIEQFLTKRDGFKKFKLRGLMSGKVGAVPFATPLNTVIELAE